MNKQCNSVFLMTLITLLLVVSCTPTYVITTKLEQELDKSFAWHVGAITDQLPAGFDPSKKPTTEDIDYFKEQLRHELIKQGILNDSVFANTTTSYEIKGGILDFKKGSGFMRFMFGFGAGSALLTVELKIVDTKSSTTLFAGNFTGKVSDWTQTGKKMWEDVAKDFAKAIKKEYTRLGVI